MKEKKEKSAKKERCFCPYCEEELIAAESPLCQLCKVTFYRCSACHVVLLDKKATICPECGAPIK